MVIPHYDWKPYDVVHIWNRGVRQDSLFREKGDFLFFKSMMWRMVQKDDCQVVCYTLMSNHYHLCLATGMVPLSKCIMVLQMSYARYFNSIYGYKGHAFESRYGATPAPDDTAILRVSRYIHLNPVKAHMVALPEEYEWSSYRGFMGIADDPFVRNSRIRDCFPEDFFRERYRNFVMRGEDTLSSSS